MTVQQNGSVADDIGIDPALLDALNYGQLQSLAAWVAERLPIAEEAAKDAALADAQAAVEKHGFSLTQLVPGVKPSASEKKPLPPKYRNPNDRLQTWSGRGRKPNWLIEEEALGKNIDDFLI